MRRETKPYRGGLPQVIAPVYRVTIDNALVRQLHELTGPWQPNVSGLDALARFRFDRRTRTASGRVPFQGTSFEAPVALYLHLVSAAGQVNILRAILGLADIIEGKVRRRGVPSDHLDDFIRSHLKLISAWAFPKVFRDSPAYMFFVHLHSLGGKCPYTKQQIEDDITAWVRADKEFPPREFITEELDRLFSQWLPLPGDQVLPFEEFCNDVFRWGTSGGAPRTEIYGREMRTKWAWGMGAIVEDGLDKYNILKKARAADKHAKVALKEESTKTRPVITTPILSYLRQCYLLYVRHSLPVPSPISSRTWLPIFQASTYRWYGCLDGDRFDQSVPKWFIMDIVDRLGAGGGDELRSVADEEIVDLEALEVTWGKKKWKWEGGLLSGWRITSVVGTIVSHLAARWIKRTLGMEGALEDGELGDDLILYSNIVDVGSQDLVEAYQSFGLKANIRKTTSGGVGEFLRKTYSNLGVLGYPALALRTISYANPWVSNYQMDFELEISNSWMTALSRFAPHSVTHRIFSAVFDLCLQDVRTQSKYTADWKSWLHTPISAGGGGCLEWSDPSRWVYIKRKDVTRVRETGSLKDILALLGVVRTSMTSAPDLTIQKIDVDRLWREVHSYVESGLPEPHLPAIPSHVNKTKEILQWYTGDYNVANLFERLQIGRLPRGLRSASKYTVLGYVLGLDEKGIGLSTVCVSKELDSHKSEVGRIVTSLMARSKHFGNIRNIGAASTLAAMSLYRGLSVAYSTW